jgi:hypothetical protein
LRRSHCYGVSKAAQAASNDLAILLGNRDAMPKRSELSGFIDPYRITCCRDGCRRQGQRGLLIGVGIAQQRARAGHGGAICSTAPRASAPVVPRLFWGTPPGNQFPKSLIVRAQWWAHKGSNLGPLPCEGNALPLSYAPGRRVEGQSRDLRRGGQGCQAETRQLPMVSLPGCCAIRREAASCAADPGSIPASRGSRLCGAAP